MASIGTTGLILILIVALILFGPSKLPELGRAFGRTLREFKNGAKELMGDDDQDQKERERKEVAPPGGNSGAYAIEADKSPHDSGQPKANANDKRLPE